MSYHSNLDYEIKNEPPTNWVYEQFGSTYGGMTPRKKESPRHEPAPSTHVAITCQKCGLTEIFSVAVRSAGIITDFEQAHTGHSMKYYFGKLIKGVVV